MRTIVSTVGALTLLVIAVPAPQAGASGAPDATTARLAGGAADVPGTWQEGVRAGTTTFGTAPGARCRPQVPGATLAQRRCVVTVSGRFVAEDPGWKGRYQGRSTVVYPEQQPGEPVFDSAAFDSGSVSYFVRESDGSWLGRLDMYVDLGTGGIYGFPGDLDVSWWIEERNEMIGVVRLTGVGVNQLDDELQPVRRYIDRSAFS